MQLHQLLRFIKYSVPIILYDINGIKICVVNSKREIDVDLYENYVLDVGLENLNIFTSTNFITYLAITLQK